MEQEIKNVRIMYIEQEEEIAKAFLDYFKKKYKMENIFWIKDFITAKNFFKTKQDIPFDLVISNLEIKNKKIFDLLEQAKKIDKNLPFIVISGDSSSEKIVKSLNKGISKYLIKPYKMEELIKYIEELSIYYKLKDSYKDLITGLYNTKKLSLDFGEYEGEDVLCILLHIEKFENLNYTYGYDFGDKVLIKFKDKIIEHYSDLRLYKVGGNQFLLFIQGMSKKVFEIQKTEIKNNLNISTNNVLYNLQMFLKQNQQKALTIKKIDIYLNITSIVGYLNKKNILSILKNFILYKTENSFNQNIHLINQDKINEIECNMKKNIEWTHKITEAFNKGYFKIYYQPIVDNNTKEIYKYEALIRMTYGDEIYGPMNFLGMSKQIKLYNKIQLMTLEKILKKIKEIKKPISFNISFQELNDYNISKIKSILDMYKEETKYLSFEILESDEIVDMNMVYDFVIEVKKYNCSIGIDDFGVAFSNINLLVSIPFDFIKFDGSLIKHIVDDKKYLDVIKNTLLFTKKYNLETIAEFVEDEDIYEETKKIGIDYSQGYYFSKPINEDLITKDYNL